METYHKKVNFAHSFYREMSYFIKENFRNIGNLPRKNFHKSLDKVFRQETSSTKYVKNIQTYTSLNEETIELLLSCSMKIAYEMYRTDIERIGNENANLRKWLREAQQKNREHAEANNKLGKRVENQERIISQKSKVVKEHEVMIENLRSEVIKGKETVEKLRSTELQHTSRSGRKKLKKAQIEIPINSVAQQQYSEDQIHNEARNMILYDIPNKWTDEEITKRIMKLGNIVSIKTKRQFKYQTVMAKIYLQKRYEELYQDKAIAVRLDNLLCRWYPAEMNLQQRKERDRWKYSAVIGVNDYFKMNRLNEKVYRKCIDNFNKQFKGEFIQIYQIKEEFYVNIIYKSKQAMNNALKEISAGSTI